MDWQTLRRWGKKAWELPLSQSLEIAYGKVETRLALKRAREKAFRQTTFVIGEAGTLESLLSESVFAAPLPKEDILALAELFCAHRFDLLGSGWQDVSYGVKAAGLEGIRYESEGAPNATRINVPIARRRRKLRRGCQRNTAVSIGSGILSRVIAGGRTFGILT